MRLYSLVMTLIAVIVAAICAAETPKPQTIRTLEDINPKASDAARIIAGWKTEVRSLDRSYMESWASLRRKYVKELEGARKAATEGDRLDDAIEIRNILEVAPTLEPSKAAEAANPALADSDKGKFQAEIKKALVGNWSGNWVTSRGALTLSIDATGLVKSPEKQVQLKVINDRYFVIWETVYQNYELIPANGRLIVLGFTASSMNKNLDPFKDRPDHVAVLERNK